MQPVAELKSNILTLENSMGNTPIHLMFQLMQKKNLMEVLKTAYQQYGVKIDDLLSTTNRAGFKPTEMPDDRNFS